MLYKPGSFSKNFAWHGDGLRKLYTVIGSGFRGNLEPVRRNAFLTDCGLDQNTRLLPVNFFLHNKDGMISVDELVYRSVKLAFNPQFNHLGLFAFHLSRVGVQSNPGMRPAMWANKFVRSRLWTEGAWQSGALDVEPLSDFLEKNLDAQPSVLQKCRTNYKHMFKLCRLIPTKFDQINSRAEQWITSALFLTWDRHILDNGPKTKQALLKTCRTEELHRLLGVTLECMNGYAQQFVDEYLELGELGRFETNHVANEGVGPAIDTTDLGRVEDAMAVQRSLVARMQQRRNKQYVSRLKELYDDTCMFCNTKLRIGHNSYYSEVAHIRPLGMPHNGPDNMSNMLVLCMNHHLQFDRGVLSVRRVDSELRIVSQFSGDPLNNKKVKNKHTLDDRCIQWHYDWYLQTSS